MNTASATETATSATWAAQTPASATAQSWAAAAATTTAYDQYYNYYQSMPPPAATAASAPLATTTASMATPAASYQQDYTQAWDDYYKAYYGQTYSATAATAATTAAATQYPTSYSYDQYGYANLSAPPPNYYDSSVAAPAASYDYSGATSASYPGYSTNWTAEPPPAFDQSYNSAAATGASAVSAVPPYDTAQSQPPPPQSFSQPPPLSAPNYEQGAYASDPSAMTAPVAAAAPGYSAESFAPPAKTSKFAPKSFDYNSAPSAAAPPPSLGGNSTQMKETSYLEQFPPPSFGSPIKPGGRGGRGGAGGGPGNQRPNNQRSMNQQQMNPRNNNNNNPRFNQQFNNNNNNNNNNRGGFAGNRPNNSNNDRRGFSNEFCEDNSGFPMNNNKQMMNNNSGMRRGGRGGGFNPRGGYQPPRNPDGPQWNQHAEMNECYGGGNNEFEDIDYSNEFPNSDEFDWGNQQMPPQHHPHQQQQPPPFMGPQHQPDYGHPQFLSPEDEDDDQMMFGQFGGQKPPLQHQQYQKPGFNNNEIPPLMSLPMGRNSNNNDGFPPGRQPPPSQMRPQQNQRPAPLLSGPGPRQGAPRFGQAGPQGPLPPARHAQPPLRLMDLTVQPSAQSPIVRRRQHALELWHTELLDIVNRRVPINRYLSVLKGALGPNMADRLSVHCFKLPPGAGVICELCLDDVFLAQARSDSVESSIEAAAKSVFELLKNNSRLCVLAATRDADGDAMPGFCVAVSPNQPVNLPPVCRPSDRIPIDSLKPLLDGGDQSIPGNSAPSSNSNNQSIPPSSVNPPVSLPANIDPSGLFLVLESATNERDQSIASLVATARFNNIVIDYQHEKLPHAPHISSCIITIDGTEVERHEARDYLMAKRQAADKVVAKLKQTRPQITVRFDKSKVVKKTDLSQPPSTAPPPSSLATATSDKDGAQSTDDKDQASALPKSFDKQALDYLKKFANSPEDVPLKFETDFSNEEKTELIKISTDLNLSHKSDGKNVLFVFKQYPLGEMKSRLVKHGFCAQYQLVAADCHSPDGKTLEFGGGAQ